MSPLRYTTPYVLGGIAAASLAAGGLWTWALPVLVYAGLPLLELFLPGTPENLDADGERAALANRGFDAVLFGTIPVVYGLLAWFLWSATAGAFSGLSLVGAVVTTGLIAGALGINVAHELGHRANPWHQRAAQLLLLPSLYMHFFIEHNRGHHMRVATDDDPASSRRGEWLYTFWVRTVVGGWRSAWDLEARRVGRTGSVWTLRNAMIRYTLIQGAFIAAIALLFSPATAALFLVTAAVGFLQLETVNYVEHYGLRRTEKSPGRHERVRPHHSWNSNHALGRTLLFELTRHSDHHAHPRRPYPVLRHFDDAPQLPTGYPGMMVLSAFPPLFFAVMDKRVDALQEDGRRALAA